MTKSFNKISLIILFALLILSAGLFGVFMPKPKTALAEGETVVTKSVDYIDYSSGIAVTKTATATKITDEQELGDLTDGFYLVEGSVDIDARFNIKGNVNIIFGKDAVLNANNGIALGVGNTLNLYSVDADAKGKLNAICTTHVGAGIGGNYAAVWNNFLDTGYASGVEMNYRYAYAGGSMGTLNVSGVNVYAKGSGGAGIGGGQGGYAKSFAMAVGNSGHGACVLANAGGNGGTLNVYNANINAVGSGGRDIGGGNGGDGCIGMQYLLGRGDAYLSAIGFNGGNGCVVNIYSSTVSARSAGIGGGNCGYTPQNHGTLITVGLNPAGNGGTLNMYGGTLIASSMGGGLNSASGITQTGDPTFVAAGLDLTVIEKQENGKDIVIPRKNFSYVDVRALKHTYRQYWTGIEPILAQASYIELKTDPNKYYVKLHSLSNDILHVNKGDKVLDSVKAEFLITGLHADTHDTYEIVRLFYMDGKEVGNDDVLPLDASYMELNTVVKCTEIYSGDVFYANSRDGKYYEDITCTKPTNKTIRTLQYIDISPYGKTYYDVDNDNYYDDMNWTSRADFLNITYTGAYEDTYFGRKTDFAFPVCPDSGYYYTFILNGKKWDGTTFDKDKFTVEVIRTKGEGEPCGEVFLNEEDIRFYNDFDFTQRAGVVHVTYTGDYTGSYFGYESGFVAPTCTEDGYDYVFMLDGKSWDTKTFTRDVVTVSVIKTDSIEDYYTELDFIRGGDPYSDIDQMYMGITADRYTTFEMEVGIFRRDNDYTVGSIYNNGWGYFRVLGDGKLELKLYGTGYSFTTDKIERYQKFYLNFGYKDDNGTAKLFFMVKKDGETFFYQEKENVELNKSDFGLFLNEMALNYCKVYQQGTLIRDYIPVRTMTGDLALFDKCESEFYYGDGFSTAPSVKPVETGEFVKKVYYCESNDKYYTDTYCVEPIDVYDITYEGEYEGSYYGDVASFVAPVCPIEGLHYVFKINGVIWDTETFPKERAFTVTVEKATSLREYLSVVDGVRSDSSVYFNVKGSRYLTFETEMCPLAKPEDAPFAVGTIGSILDYNTIMGLVCNNSSFWFYVGYYGGPVSFSEDIDFSPWQKYKISFGYKNDNGTDVIFLSIKQGDNVLYYKQQSIEGKITYLEKSYVDTNIFGAFGQDMLLYSCKIYDNGELIRDIVPVTDGAQNYYLFDEQNQKLFNVNNVILTSKPVDLGVSYGTVYFCNELSAYFVDSGLTQRLEIYDVTYEGDYVGRYLGSKESFALPVCDEEGAYYVYLMDGEDCENAKFVRDKFTVTVKKVVKYDKVDVDCTTAGHEEYYEHNHKYYSDGLCKDEIEDLTSWLSPTGNGYIAPLGHDYTITYEWEGATCKAKAVCNHDRTHRETETVTGEYVKDTDKTCENPEKGHYEATFSSDLFSEQETETGSVENGDPLGHDYEITYTWNGTSCTATYACTHGCGIDTVTETVTGEYVKDTDKTCENPEKGHYKVTFSSDLFSEQETETGSVNNGDPLGHDYEITYAWNGTSCTATAVCKHDNSHTVTETVTGAYVKDSDKTCENPEKGHCKITFSSDLFSEQETETGSVTSGDPLGHNFNNYVSDGNATCEHDGTKTSKCSRCEVTDTVTDEGSKLGHDYKITYEWNGSSCTATYSCSHGCEIGVVTETVVGEYVKDTDKTCENPEKGHYKATFSSDLFSEQKTETGSVNNGDPLGHDYEITYTWNGTSCTATAVCKHDNSHKVVETVTGAYVKDSDATSESNEKGHDEATFDNPIFAKQAGETNSVEIPDTRVYEESSDDGSSDYSRTIIISVISVIASVCLIAMVVMLVIRKKKNKNV